MRFRGMGRDFPFGCFLRFLDGSVFRTELRFQDDENGLRPSGSSIGACSNDGSFHSWVVSFRILYSTRLPPRIRTRPGLSNPRGNHRTIVAMDDLWQSKIVANGSQKLVRPRSTLVVNYACVAYEQPKTAKADGRGVLEFWPEDQPSAYRRGAIASFARSVNEQSKLNLVLEANRSYCFIAKGSLNIHVSGRYINPSDEEAAWPPPASAKNTRVNHKQSNATASSSKARGNWSGEVDTGVSGGDDEGGW
ncbi:hypothetical protein FA13DRAFT_1717859 [Coprinellus micaceus]|uniref:Nucleoplasmin-like domain-containing protein n=1 Tax=Coprinellus micaceus TaxID=71717 RepID=A0A4Y7SFE4_COPMI|nr:hypothetical protein FA13DRAFT_1717859 [Coprinellus micaceus]